MWHVSSRSGVATLRTAIHLLLTYLLTGLTYRLRVGIPSRYVTNQLGQLSLASLRGRLIEYQLRLG